MQLPSKPTTRPEWRHEIEFANQGVRYHIDPIRVTLDASPLKNLFAQAIEGHRLYELAMIRQPRDIWSYVLVWPVELPNWLRVHWNQWQPPWKPGQLEALEPPLPCIPMNHFDGFFLKQFYHALDRWRDYRYYDPALARFANNLFLEAKEQFASVVGKDSLADAELGRIEAGLHVYDILPFAEWITVFPDMAVLERHFTDEFYAVVDRLIGDECVQSVYWQGLNDWKLFKMLCQKQRQRANEKDCSFSEAFSMVLPERHEEMGQVWGVEAEFLFKSWDTGDLYIRQDDDCFVDFSAIVDDPFKCPRGYILSDRDLGNLNGFGKDNGNGWTLYTKNITDRSSLEVKCAVT
jgi:hypothetical protein